jgi:protein involved in polysaccharide export with SLBB domain
MAKRQGMFLVRDALGKMRTVMGTSHRGVMRTYLEHYRVKPGDVIEVKLRGVPDDWQAFKVS